jgi:dihydrofolate synthase / folylpolyglutamate synthase
VDYHRSLDYLFGLQKFGIKLGLDNIRTLLDRLGSPHQQFAILHIAGTNGKGSTSAALADILRGCGYRVGLYTSPHLHSFTERIQVNRQPISEPDVVALTKQLRQLACDLPITFFEFTTAMALEYFRQAKVDLAILETGMGGRLDATNAVTPTLSLITPISHDHELHLGRDLASIAAEKGGIIKPGIPVCVGPQATAAKTVLESRAAAVGAPYFASGTDWTVRSNGDSFSFAGFGWDLPRVKSGLPGVHQHENLGLALGAAALLANQGWTICAETAVERLAELKWPGRLEWWQGIPDLLLDAAHNPAGCQALVDYFGQAGLDRVHLVTGFKADKDWRSMLQILLPHVRHAYVAEPEIDQVAVPHEIAGFLARRGVGASCHATPGKALEKALAVRLAGEPIVVAGSIFLISAVRSWLVDRENDIDEMCS